MIAALAILSLAVGGVLGLLGGGGSILTVPLLAYVAGLPAGQAVAGSLIVVAGTSALGVLLHARNGAVRWRLGLLFGVVAMAGAYGGGRMAKWFPGWLLLVLFALLMLATALFMLKRKTSEERSGDQAPRWTILTMEAAAVGCVTGLVGAGGGFLVVPALVAFGGLHMREAIGTSLVIIAMNSTAGVFGHLSHVQLDYGIVGLVLGGALVGTALGAHLSRRISGATLQKSFAWLVLAMAILMLAIELHWAALVLVPIALYGGLRNRQPLWG